MIEYILKRVAHIGKTNGSEGTKANAAIDALEKQPWMKFLSGEFLDAFTQEVDAIKDELDKTGDSLWDEGLWKKMDLLQIRLETVLSGDRDTVAYFAKRYIETDKRLKFLGLGDFP